MTWPELIAELRESIGLKTGPVGARRMGKRMGFQYGPPGLQDVGPEEESLVDPAEVKARRAKELRRKAKAAKQYGPPELQGIGPKVQLLAPPRPY